MLKGDVLGIFWGEKVLNASVSNALSCVEKWQPFKRCIIICMLLKGCGYSTTL
jgi:hypothetical protein